MKSYQLLSIGAAMFAVMLAVSLFAPLISSYDPAFVPRGGELISPNGDHWFGTDQQGRDVFARVVFGGRVSLLAGLGSAALATAIGVVVGSIAGLRRRWLDNVLMRSTDVFFVFPTIVLAACFVLVFGRHAWAVVLAIGFSVWPQMARVVRGVVIEAGQSLYVEAARSTGLPERTVFRLHVLPRVVSVVLALSIAAVATGILTESALSFLGIGISDPASSWGLMIASGRRFLTTEPYLVFFPALAIVVTVGSLVLMHEALSRKAPNGGGQRYAERVDA